MCSIIWVWHIIIESTLYFDILECKILWYHTMITKYQYTTQPYLHIHNTLSTCRHICISICIGLHLDNLLVMSGKGQHSINYPLEGWCHIYVTFHPYVALSVFLALRTTADGCNFVGHKPMKIALKVHGFLAALCSK